MPGVLTTASQVTCGHAPPAPPGAPPGAVAVEGAPPLHVGGSPVLVKAGVAGKSISGCGTKPTSDPSGTVTTSPCVKVESVSAGEATKLFVNGKAVLTADLKGVTGNAATQTGLIAKGTAAAALAGAPTQTFLTTA
jgi:hypothetical protein